MGGKFKLQVQDSDLEYHTSHFLKKATFPRQIGLELQNLCFLYSALPSTPIPWSFWTCIFTSGK